MLPKAISINPKRSLSLCLISHASSTVAQSILQCSHGRSTSAASLAGPDLCCSTDLQLTPYSRGGNPVAQGMPPLTLSTNAWETVKHVPVISLARFSILYLLINKWQLNCTNDDYETLQV